MPTYNNIHRQQLFHWIGSHIDKNAAKGRLSDDLREEYVACLSDALDHGLWVQKPQVPDLLGKGDLIKITRPITCFTEWSLGQSLPHTSRYGRLGLGFPKRFVLARGGQPVTYVRDSPRRNPYTAALLALARALKGDAEVAASLGKKLPALQGHFDYLAHFNKTIKKTRKTTAVAVPRAKKLGAAATGATKKKPDIYARSYGDKLHYLEEREWRIVYDGALASFFELVPPGPDRPAYYLPFVPGRELFTVVLPDNRTVNIATQREDIRQHLFQKDVPHVTLLSLQDIGTF